MVAGAEHIGAGLASTRATPRITRVGALLRRTSLDELPNLVNVAARRDVDRRPAPDGPGAGRPVHDAPARPARGQARASPAGRRSTGARRCRGPSGSSSTSGTSTTARCGSTSRSSARTARMLVTGEGLYKGETGADGRRHAVSRRSCSPASASATTSSARSPQHAIVDRGRPEPARARPVRGARARARRRASTTPATSRSSRELVRRARRRRRGAAHRPRHRGARARARTGPARLRARPRDRARDLRQVRDARAAAARTGCPRRRRCCPARSPTSYPVMVKPRRGSGARSIHPAADRERGGVLRRLRRRSRRWCSG